MPVEIVTVEQFRGIFGDVPELTQPAVFKDSQDRNIIVAFDKFQLEDRGHNHFIGTVETTPYLNPNVDSESHLVRVRYDSLYGLKARAFTLFRKILREKRESELLVVGHMEQDFGPVSIVHKIQPVSFLHANYSFLLQDSSAYAVSVEVYSSNHGFEKPPMAQVAYNKGDIVMPVRGELVDASYEGALKEGVEERYDSLHQRSNHPYSYFLWQYLRGLRVGRTRFLNRQGSELEWFERTATISPKLPNLLKGSLYKAGLYYEPKRVGPYSFGEATLSFARISIKTGESWILSVPEWIDSEALIRSLSVAAFNDFFYEYPVVFGVRRPNQQDQWFKTPGRYDREKAILDALPKPLQLPTQT